MAEELLIFQYDTHLKGNQNIFQFKGYVLLINLKLITENIYQEMEILTVAQFLFCSPL